MYSYRNSVKEGIIVIYQFTLDDIKNNQINENLEKLFYQIDEKYNHQITDKYFNDVCDTIVSFTGKYRNQEINFSDPNTSKIKECIAIAISFYKESIKSKRISLLLITLLVFDFFNQDYSLLNPIKVNKEFQASVVKLFESFNIQISIPKNAPYNDKKLLEIFEKARTSTDYKNIFGIMDNLRNNSNAFSHIEYSWAVFIRFLYHIDKQVVINIIENCTSFEKIEIFLLSLNGLNDFDYLKNCKNNYLLLRSLKYFFESLDNGYVKTNRIKEIPDYTKLIISLFSRKDIAISEYIKVLRLQYYQSFNYLLAWAWIFDRTLLDIYLNYGSLSEREAKSISLGFLLHVKADEDILSVAEKIKILFFEKELTTYSSINIYTGFLDLFGAYYSIKFPNRQKYLIELKNKSQIIMAIQNSWNFDSLMKAWIELFYFSLSNINNKFEYTESELQESLSVIFDKRNQLIIDPEFFEVMKDILITPNKLIKFKMKSTLNREYNIEFNK